MALTREEALKELLQNEREIARLETLQQNLKHRQGDLQKIVLLQAGDPEEARRLYIRNVSPRVRSGTANEEVLKVLVEHGGWLTANEVHTLRGGSGKCNATRLTLDRLIAKHLINKDNSHIPVRYQIAIHRDSTEVVS